MSDNLMGIVGLLREDLARMEERLLNQLARDHSPWMCANSAARYADCSPATIHKAAARGFFTRYDTFTGPRFKKEEIDRALALKMKRKIGETEHRERAAGVSPAGPGSSGETPEARCRSTDTPARRHSDSTSSE